MAKIYIANTTKQNHEFTYRKPEENGMSAKLYEKTIPAGGQVEIDVDDTQVDPILDQHTNYGLTKYDDISDAEGFTGLVYRVGKPVDVDRIVEGIDKRDDVLTKRSQGEQQAVVLAADEKNRELSRGSGAEVGPAVMEVKEQKNGANDNGKKVAQKITADRSDG